MSQFLANIAPLIAFMLIPVWIPVLAILAGKVVDIVSPRQPDAIELRRLEREARRQQVALAETD